MLEGAAQRCSRFMLGYPSFWLPSESIQSRSRLRRQTTPDCGIADVIERRNLTAGELFTLPMGQHLLFELRTVSASLGEQAVDAMHAVVAHPGADL